jgi:vacuolar-type H+-ATPase subunit F/Vma7
MAILVTSLERAINSKQKPTDGEIFLLEYLANAKHFDDKVEVYFQPCFNGDRPDIVLMSPNRGVIIIEVKDWDLSLYQVDSKNKWSVKTGSRSQSVKSPLAQLFAYKKNFFDIHINGLLEKTLEDKRFFGIINTFAYYHKGCRESIQCLYQAHLDRLHDLSCENNRSFQSTKVDYDAYQKEEDRIKQASKKFERDMLLSVHKNTLHKIRFPPPYTGNLFDEPTYHEFKRLLNPPYHYASEGAPPGYTEKQSRLIVSAPKARAKIRGLAGSGKTVVLAGRAVNAHKRHGGKVLILTFNITLGSYIHDKISAVREDFSWGAFEIFHYHRFITKALNNAEIPITIPEHLQYEGNDPVVARRIGKERDEHLESSYYCNLSLFKNVEVDAKYDTILIDEIQDYKPEWIKIVRAYFLEEDGELVLFGDEKQNIYKRELDNERRSKVVEGFGRWEVLTKSFRYASSSPIIPLVDAFQKSFLHQDYELDSDESYQLTLVGVGVQAYGAFDQQRPDKLAEQIISLAQRNMKHPNDISIISSQEDILQKLDSVLRTSHKHKERTLCTFPSLENKKDYPTKVSTRYKELSTARKIGFNLNSGVMKLSSTHSFKGFESPFVFLLVSNHDSPEMVFTGLTRAKEGLVVYLETDSPYQDFFSKHLNPIETIVPPDHY